MSFHPPPHPHPSLLCLPARFSHAAPPRRRDSEPAHSLPVLPACLLPLSCVSPPSPKQAEGIDSQVYTMGAPPFGNQAMVQHVTSQLPH